MSECEAERDALKRRVERLKVANEFLRRKVVELTKRNQDLLTGKDRNRWN